MKFWLFFHRTIWQNLQCSLINSLSSTHTSIRSNQQIKHLKKNTYHYTIQKEEDEDVGPKLGYTPLGQKFQQNAPFLKLFRDMPLCWSSTLRKSSFSVELEFMELESFENFQVELEFLKYIYIYIYKFDLAVTWFFKIEFQIESPFWENCVSKHGHIAR